MKEWLYHKFRGGNKINIDKVNIAASLIIVLVILGFLALYFLPPDPCFEWKQKMNPYGTGYQEITITTKIYNDGTLAEEAYETDEGELVGYEQRDRSGNLVSGFKYESGIYYEWVLDDPTTPGHGEWAEKTPPAEIVVERVNIFCHTRILILFGILFGLLLLQVLLWVEKKKEST